MTFEQYQHLKSTYARPDAISELAVFARGIRERAQQRAVAETARKEGVQKDRVAKELAARKQKMTISALTHEPRKKVDQAIQTGEKGGKYYVSESGEKHYVKD